MTHREMHLDVQELPGGTYFIKLFSSMGLEATGRFTRSDVAR